MCVRVCVCVCVSVCACVVSYKSLDCYPLIVFVRTSKLSFFIVVYDSNVRDERTISDTSVLGSIEIDSYNLCHSIVIIETSVVDS